MLKAKIKNILNNKVFKDSFIYVLTDIINASLPFFLLPILTYYITPNEYGKLAIFNSLISVLIVLIGQGIINLLSVNFYKNDKSRFKKFVFNMLLIINIVSVFIFFCILIFKDFINIQTSLDYKWFIVSLVLSYFNLISSVYLTILILERKPKIFGIFQISITLIKFAFSLLFVVYLLLSWEGRIFGILTGSIIAGLVALYFIIKKYIVFILDKKIIKEIIFFYIPLIPHQLSGWLKNGATILLMAGMVNTASAGLYDVALKFVIPLSIISVSINKAWMPALYSKLSSNPNLEEKKKIVKFIYLFFAIFLLLAFAITLAAPIILRTIFDKQYFGTIDYVLILSLATAVSSIYPFFINFIYYTKKVKYISLITVGTAILSVLLTYFFLKTNVKLGPAYAFLITAIISTFFTFIYSQIIYPMPWLLYKKQKS